MIDQSYENLRFYLETIEPGFLNYTNEKSNISILYSFVSQSPSDGQMLNEPIRVKSIKRI